MDKPKPTPIRLKITGCSLVFTGTNVRGDEYKIYELAAEKENGELVTGQKLNSFEDLPTGEVLDLTVVPFSGTKGVSYTIARKHKVGSLVMIRELQAQVDALTERVKVLERVLNPAKPADSADLDAKYGAEAPY